MAWHQPVATSSFLWLHMDLAFQRSSLIVTGNFGGCLRGTLTLIGALEACLVDEFVFCFPDPGLWPRTMPSFSLPVSYKDLQPGA